MLFDADQPGRLVLRDGETVVAEYVYDAPRAAEESPRPYLLLRTRSGAEVTAHRPADHVWHSGLSLALPVVGVHNFWGGPTYVSGKGYLPLADNGSQQHRDFLSTGEGKTAAPDVAAVEEVVEWVAAGGAVVLREQRRLTARPVDEQTWALTWRSVLRNASGAALALGSPATNGRAGAGYGGIFWRGPTSFRGGGIVTPDGPVGDAALGRSGPWQAFIAPDRSAGVLLLDGGHSGGGGDGSATPWFARSEEYAGLGPAPFFSEERMLAPDDELVLSAAVVIGGAGVAAFADPLGESLRRELDAPARKIDA